MSTVSKVIFEGREANFSIDNPNDHIQGFHTRGEFYEIRQLLAHRNVIPMHSTVVDIGANVGNHTIFYAMYTWASVIYPFEPNASAQKVLQANLSNNTDLRAKIDTSYIQLALGRSPSRLKLVPGPANNLGGTKLAPPSGGDGEFVECVRLDDLPLGGDLSFLKIDVEGMELDVLAGAAQTISKYRPTIALEIWHRQEVAFWEWLTKNKYEVVGVYFDYLYVKNYIVIPRG